MTDPKRLIDPDSGSSPAVRALVRAARSDLPSGGRVEVMGERLAPWLGGASGGAPHAGPAPGIAISGAAAAGVKVATATKAGAVVLVALGVAAGGYAEMHHSRTAPSPTARATFPLAASPSPTVVARVASPTVIDRAASSAAPDGTEPAPKAMPQRSPAPSRAAPSALDTSFESEVALLQSAQDALSANPLAALSLATRHAARFPQGTLAQESEVIAIEALLNLGRRDEARARASSFYRAFPRSAHRPRIEELLGDEPTHNP